MHMYKKNKLTITSIFKYVIELSKVNLILNNFLSQIRGIICFILYQLNYVTISKYRNKSKLLLDRQFLNKNNHL